ncbi:conserved hypothetical protein, partial [Ricinus communis]
QQGAGGLHQRTAWLAATVGERAHARQAGLDVERAAGQHGVDQLGGHGQRRRGGALRAVRQHQAVTARRARHHADEADSHFIQRQAAQFDRGLLHQFHDRRHRVGALADQAAQAAQAGQRSVQAFLQFIGGLLADLFDFKDAQQAWLGGVAVAALQIALVYEFHGQYCAGRGARTVAASAAPACKTRLTWRLRPVAFQNRRPAGCRCTCRSWPCAGSRALRRSPPRGG